MKRSKLYRQKWEKFHGKKIPKGYHIHHRDGDATNDNIENLECLSPEDHAKRHLEMGHKILNSGFIVKANNRKNIPRSAEEKAKISNSKRGICTVPRTVELREKVSRTMGAKPFVVIKDGVTLGTFINMSKFCIEYNLNRRNVITVLNKYPHRKVKGYNFKYEELTNG